MADYRTNERIFNLDSLERSNWRSRINQLKRELRSNSNFPAPSTSTGSGGATPSTPAPAKRSLPKRRVPPRLTTR